jgi:hypothetical protein
MTTEEDLSKDSSNREGAAVVYYGKTFKPYGATWVRNGLLNFVPTDLIRKVLLKNVPIDVSSLDKEELVDRMMIIYNHSNSDKKRIESWIFSHRFRRKVQTDFPFLKRLESFYMFLRTNPTYKISVPPDAATKVAAQLTLTGITSLPEVKSVLKSVLCKKESDWKVFDSLFNKWFTSTIEQYGGQTIIAPSTNYLHFESDPSISLESALAKLRGVLTPEQKGGAGGKDESDEDEDEEKPPDESPNEEEDEADSPPSDKQKTLRSEILSLLRTKGPIHIDDLKSALKGV